VQPRASADARSLPAEEALMKAGVLLAAVLVFTAPVPAAAQQWTANEQSLLEHIRMCWDGIGKMSYGRFAVECNFDPEVAYWWTEESAPSVGIDWWRPNAQANWARLQVIAQDLRPIRITQHGDMYFVFFVGLRTFAEADGTPQQNEWQGFEVWQQTGDTWRFLGGMGTPTRNP
jgi:hypothetical protein